jgi:hypothetical protein
VQELEFVKDSGGGTLGLLSVLPSLEACGSALQALASLRDLCDGIYKYEISAMTFTLIVDLRFLLKTTKPEKS